MKNREKAINFLYNIALISTVDKKDNPTIDGCENIEEVENVKSFTYKIKE